MLSKKSKIEQLSKSREKTVFACRRHDWYDLE
jgi:hypothetical protein